ncbi:hypothetical protein J6590_060994 [Homalodisca vitripennis]|nr:hypothetical protein J6590_060994 [Homalodisca vitripennis]
MDVCLEENFCFASRNVTSRMLALQLLGASYCGHFDVCVSPFNGYPNVLVVRSLLKYTACKRAIHINKYAVGRTRSHILSPERYREHLLVSLTLARCL